MLRNWSLNPLAKVAIGILRKYGTDAHVYLPGIGTVSGLTAGNYLDSAGTTAASVDNPVGLSLDALQAMTLGSELATNGDNEAALFNLGVMSSQNITPSRVAAVGGRSGFVMRGLSSSAASVNHQYNCVNATLSANTTYLISVDVYVPTGGISSCKFFDNDDGSFFSPDVTTKDAWVTITAIRQPKATPWTLGFGNNSLDVVASGSPAFYLDNVSIKQIPGIHASQATTANKPILRRGLLNQATYSSDLTNASCVVTATASKSGQTLLLPATYDAMSKSVTTAAGAQTFAFLLSGTGTVSIYANNGTDGSMGVKAVTLTSTPTLYLSNISPTVATSSYLISREAGNTATSVNFGGVGLFQGTYTAQQILDAGGIPLTTTAAASNPSAGKYSWQFDGSNDSLSLSAPLFQMSDDHAVIAGLNALRANDYVLNFGSGASTQQVAAIYLSGSVVAASWVDNAETISSVAEITPSLGVTKVACAVKISNAKRLRINGVQQGATDNAVRGATTVSAGFIGGFKSGSLPFSGSLYPVIAIKGTVTDSDLLTLERFVGRLSGVSL